MVHILSAHPQLTPISLFSKVCYYLLLLFTGSLAEPCHPTCVKQQTNGENETKLRTKLYNYKNEQRNKPKKGSFGKKSKPRQQHNIIKRLKERNEETRHEEETKRDNKITGQPGIDRLEVGGRYRIVRKNKKNNKIRTSNGKGQHRFYCITSY